MSVAAIASHPTWVRGLKLEERALASAVGMSHPTWVRGLKPGWYRCTPQYSRVAPYVGAWIETCCY